MPDASGEQHISRHRDVDRDVFHVHARCHMNAEVETQGHHPHREYKPDKWRAGRPVRPRCRRSVVTVWPPGGGR